MQGLNFLLMIVFFGILSVVLIHAAKKSINEQPPSMRFRAVANGVVVDVVETLPASLRPYICSGCGDGMEPGWYFPVVEYRYDDMLFTGTSLKGVRSKRRFRIGKKVRISINEEDPKFFIVET